jgi:glyoxylase-like metal-dependent hydrolase (beta-lactamase superfamily II)
MTYPAHPLIPRSSLLFVLGAVLAVPNVVPAQSAAAAAEQLRATARGLALIDSAIAAHGGLSKLRGIEDASVRYRGRRWMAYQSTTSAPPWVTQPTLSDLVMDLKNDRLYRYNVNRFPLDFSFAGAQAVSGTNVVFWDPSRAGQDDALRRVTASQSQTVGARREIPAFELLQVRDRAESVRWVGDKTEEGRRLHGVSYAQPNGAIYTLWIDAETKRLTRLEWLRDDAVDGDQLASYTYSGYRMEQGVPVPSRLVERRNGELVRDDTLTISLNSHPADSLFTGPTSGFAEGGPTTGPESESIRKLADNVWLLQQLPGGNRVMFVAFRDYVLVFEAPTPQAAATAVMDAVKKTVPDKPIRYVAFSHAHDDHGGGLRPYIADGITIVTTAKTRPFVDRVANAKHTLRPDVLDRSPRAAVVETFSRKRVFTDGDMTVELHDIGPTSHVDEIVLAYLPKQKLIFQGDLVILPARGAVPAANALTAEFAKAIQRLGLDVETIAGVHGRVGTLTDIREAVAKRP